MYIAFIQDSCLLRQNLIYRITFCWLLESCPSLIYNNKSDICKWPQPKESMLTTEL